MKVRHVRKCSRYSLSRTGISQEMTVSYAGTFSKQLCRWKGSVYKALWLELVVFLLLYYSVFLLYRLVLNENQQKYFAKCVVSMSNSVELIPVEFLLGFFISIIRKRFPTTAHLVRAGLMTPEEQQLYQSYHTPFDKWWVPTMWILDQLRKHRDSGSYHPSLFRGLAEEVELWRSQFQKMMHFDWVCLPLVYTQVVTIAVYGYFLCCLLGRQILLSEVYGYNPPIFFPIGTVLQFIFYVGWLKVGEALIDPFGEDDEDFELNWILDRNTYVAYMMVDTCAKQLPPPEPTMDPRVEKPLLYTKAAANILDKGPADHLTKFIPDAEEVELMWANFQHLVTERALRHRIQECAAVSPSNCIS